jgi:pSer/pThr/pTyr-binding forkhead associated (FHA) protein
VEGKQFELKKNKLTIGRSPFNDIIIKSASVSASHAELKRGKGCWVLRDIGSVNGISVNGEYGIQGDEFDLSISDQILIGDAVLQLCSPHTIDEISAKPLLLNQARSYKKLYIAVGFITAAVAVVFLLV